MIRVAYFRHGKKDGEKIAKSCLDDIHQNGIPGLNGLLPGAKRIVIHLGTGWYRTYQTAKEYQGFLERNGYGSKVANFQIPNDKRLGSKVMFDEMNADKALAKVAEEKNWTYAIINAGGEHYRYMRQHFLDAMYEIADYLEDGDLCISIGHNGIIECIGNHFNPDIVPEDLSLGELEGIVFNDVTRLNYSDKLEIIRQKETTKA